MFLLGHLEYAIQLPSSALCKHEPMAPLSSLKVEFFSWCHVVVFQRLVEIRPINSVDVCVAWQISSESSVGVFNVSFLQYLDIDEGIRHSAPYSYIKCFLCIHIESIDNKRLCFHRGKSNPQMQHHLKTY